MCVHVCTVRLWFSTTPRLHVASYKKNSFSMTEWRIGLEGSGQSSGTPLKDVCPALLCSCPFICAPCVEKKVVRRALGRVSSAAKLLLNLLRNCQEFFYVAVTESDTVFRPMCYCFLLPSVKRYQVTYSRQPRRTTYYCEFLCVELYLSGHDTFKQLNVIPSYLPSILLCHPLHLSSFSAW